ncbi:MAG: DUF4293 domain-containing protein, partial [Bacteroidales bacterium]|nr:DUF4293 domain-containing protein [Bacteroidales bacterium]
MIQRIQTIYLLLATVILVLILFLPIASMVDAQANSFSYLFYGVVDSSNTLVIIDYPLAIILGLIPFLNLVTIFLYKSRILQMRICIFNILLMLGSLALIWFYSYEAENVLFVDTYFSYPVVFPLVAAILTFMA